MKNNIRLKALLSVFAIATAGYVAYWYAGGDREREQKQEQEVVGLLLKQNAKQVFTKALVTGMTWEKMSADGWREIYHFAADGSLPRTIITPDGKTSAGLLQWKLNGDEMVFSDFNGHVVREYHIIGLRDNKVYLFGGGHNIESFAVRPSGQ